MGRRTFFIGPGWRFARFSVEKRMDQAMEVRLAENDEDIEKCFPLITQLRTSLTYSRFAERVKAQMKQYGYRLAYLEDEGKIKALAGFRISEMLSRGRFLYIDDLIIHVKYRSMGFGSALFRWLVDYARREGCREIHVDPGAQWREAYRFYLRNGMQINGYHFMMKIE